MSHRRRFGRAALVLAMAALSGCADLTGKRLETGVPDQLEGTVWEASRILTRPATAALSALEFREAGAIGGTAGCNRFQGSAMIAANTMTFGPLAVTKRMCQPAVNGQETVFLEALDMTHKWQVIGNVLELLDNNDDVVMVLIRSER
ncbi:MAG: META domain-containing protein [Gammaproteobacteria bacterium]|nr:META domain-containing protein [Gammaproteobacteria bacterium]